MNTNFRPAHAGSMKGAGALASPFGTKRRLATDKTPVAHRQGRRPDATGRSTGRGLRWSHMASPHSFPAVVDTSGNSAGALPQGSRARTFLRILGDWAMEGGSERTADPEVNARRIGATSGTNCRLSGSVVGNPADVERFENMMASNRPRGFQPSSVPLNDFGRPFGAGLFPLALNPRQELGREASDRSCFPHEAPSPTPQASEKIFPKCRKLQTPNRTILPAFPETNPLSSNA